MVVPYDDSAMWVAEDDLCSHVDEFVNEEESAFEHLLVDEHRAFGLGSNDKEHTQEVGREAWPRGVGERHDASVDERADFLAVVMWYVDVVALAFDADTHAAECIGDDAEVFVRNIFDGDIAAGHGCHAYE